MERKVNEKGLMEKGAYGSAPLAMRLKAVFQRGWHFLVFALPLLFITIWFVAQLGLTGGTWALLGVLAVTLGIGAWATYWYGFSKVSRPGYEVRGMDVEFSGDYYVPMEVMGPFIDEVAEAFEPVVDIDPLEMLKGVTLVITENRPVDPGKRVPADQVVGLTYPGSRSIVYGPYALSHGGAGYELRLQMCHVLFPGRSEGEDIEWMKEHGIV